jgi:hypothetical protein
MGVSPEMRHRIVTASGNRCGYCHSPQHLMLGPLEIDHLVPSSRGGRDDETNLWLACRLCNNHKQDRVEGRDGITQATVRIFNPRTDAWNDHFVWSADYLRIIGTTPRGRVTADLVQLNDRSPSKFDATGLLPAGILPREICGSRTRTPKAATSRRSPTLPNEKVAAATNSKTARGPKTRAARIGWRSRSRRGTA